MDQYAANLRAIAAWNAHYTTPPDPIEDDDTPTPDPDPDAEYERRRDEVLAGDRWRV